MALTKVMTYGVIKHVSGDQYTIPVTLELKDGASTVFTHSEDVEHKTTDSVMDSLTHQQVVNKFEDAVLAYLGEKEINDLNTEITQALQILSDKIPTTKKG